MKEDEERENASEEEEDTNGKTWRREGDSCLQDVCECVSRWKQEVEEYCSVYRHTHHGAPAAH